MAIVADPKQARDTLAELGIHVEPLRTRKARGPPVQLDLPPPDHQDGLHPVNPD